MQRLLVNPGTPQVWEIPLKPGTNRIGRVEDNDFTIPHASVSSHHCEVIVTDDGVFLRDLGSTNGSFLNRKRVTETLLQHGQHLQFGSVDLLFESGNAATPKMQAVVSLLGEDAAALIPPPPKPAIKAPPVVVAAGSSALAPARQAMVDVRDAFCKSHPKTPARFFCSKCNVYFCDLCVATHSTHGVGQYNCRLCGGVCAPVRVHITPPKEEKLGFFGRLSGAFAYPFTGSGIFLLIGGSVMYVLLHFCPIMIVIGNLWMKAWGLIGTMVIGGYLAAFLQSIVHTTATGDKEMPSMPSVTNMWDDVLLPAFQCSGVLFACFGPFFAFLVLAVANDSLFANIIWIPALALGFCYFPMAYLAVVTLDSIKAINPVLVVRSIMRVPVEYFATLGLLLVVAVLAMMGDMVMVTIFFKGLFTTSVKKFFLMVGLVMTLIFFGFYLITVSVRVLGLLFVSKREKLGWFGE